MLASAKIMPAFVYRSRREEGMATELFVPDTVAEREDDIQYHLLSQLLG